MGRSKLINVELAFASEHEQVLLQSTLPEGTSARDAISNSDLPCRFPDVDFAECPLGIWGRLIDDAQSLKEGDRVEAYRQLLREPREARRELALAGRSMGKPS